MKETGFTKENKESIQIDRYRKRRKNITTKANIRRKTKIKTPNLESVNAISEISTKDVFEQKLFVMAVFH